MSKRNFAFLGLGYFAVLFNYPLVRASSTTLFVEAFGAKSSPQGWLVAVAMLMVAVWAANKFQAKFGFHKAFLAASLFSVLLFSGSYLSYTKGIKWGAFALFSWKEVYIVLQVHLLLAYANTWLGKKDFVRWIGPLGALGSLGGILGGLLTSWIAKTHGTGAALIIGQVFVLMAAVFALFLDKIPGTAAIEDRKTSPLQSLDSVAVRNYVFSIAAIVALAQIVINISDFQFSLLFEAAIQDASERTAYLGTIYTATNGLTLALQILVLPVVLRFFGERSLHFFIPLSYLLCLVFGLGSGVLAASAIFYTYLKASDYSLFSAGKELLYHPLAPMQKYGAKYLTDMFVYRTAKAAIAGVLIYFQSPEMLVGMMVTALILWLIFVIAIFVQHRRLFS